MNYRNNVQKNELNQTCKFCEEMPPLRLVERIKAAGQENPFVSQFFSVLISRSLNENLHSAPLNFIACLDLYKVKKAFKLTGSTYRPKVKNLFLVSLSDTLMAAGSIVKEANRLGLGTCYSSNTLTRVKKIREKWRLPELVIPLLTISAGYAEEKLPPQVPFPREFIYFEDEYAADEAFGLSDMVYQLDNSSDLINYYEKITELYTGKEQNFSNWIELLKYNCQVWGKEKRNFLEICRLCGLELDI